MKNLGSSTKEFQLNVVGILDLECGNDIIKGIFKKYLDCIVEWLKAGNVVNT